MARDDAVIANNYTYNFGEQMVHFDGTAHPDITAVGLCFEDGNNSDSDVPVFLYGGDVYAKDVTTDPTDHPLTDSSTNLVDSPRVLPSGLDLDRDVVASSEVKEFVLGRAGSRPARRPPVESGIVNRLNSDHSFIDAHPYESRTGSQYCPLRRAGLHDQRCRFNYFFGTYQDYT